MVSVATLYNWVDAGLLRIKNKDLLLKVKRKKRKRNQHEKKRILGKSIEDRPKEVDKREEFGHWEGDGIVSKDHKGGHLISLVERKTGMGLLYYVDTSEGTHMVKILDMQQKEYKNDFSKIFNTITFDNGPEGADYVRMEKGNRTSIYYAHPYSSFERGTNEQWNSMVRRFIPKGSSFDTLKKGDIQRITNYINSLPRKRFNYKTPLDMWEAEIARISTA